MRERGGPDQPSTGLRAPARGRGPERDFTKERVAHALGAYDAVRELAELKHLEHLSDSVIEEYEEGARA